MGSKIRQILFGIVIIFIGLFSFGYAFAYVYTGTSDALYLLPILIITVGFIVLVRGFKTKKK